MHTFSVLPDPDMGSPGVHSIFHFHFPRSVLKKTPVWVGGCGWVDSFRKLNELVYA